MKLLPLLAFSFFLIGCVGERSDLELFVTTTKAQHVAHIPPLKEPPKFEHFAYQAELMRSPFVPPSRELTKEVVDTTKNCLQPDFKHRKGQLESYALDNLKMRGTLSQGGITWALVESNDGSVYRVGSGDYLGLFNGRIAKVTSQSVEVIELIPDGSGCWSERSNNIVLSGE